MGRASFRMMSGLTAAISAKDAKGADDGSAGPPVQPDSPGMRMN